MFLSTNLKEEYQVANVTLLQDSELNLVDAQLALQMKIFEAARKLCEEDRLSKAVKRSRIVQCKREEKKLKRLQEIAFQLRLERGRSSPLPAFNIVQGESCSTQTHARISWIFTLFVFLELEDYVTFTVFKVFCLTFRAGYIR